MATFPRTLPSIQASPARVPMGLRAVSRTGRVQVRGLGQSGRMWTETWGAIEAGTVNTEALLAFIEHQRGTLTAFDITHPMLPGSGIAPLVPSTPPGAPLVQGANQSGDLIITDTWGVNNTTVMAGGDHFTFAGITVLFRVLDDQGTNGSGRADLAISPAIQSGNEPADNAALTLTGNVLNCIIVDYQPGSADPGEYMVGMNVTFLEVP